MWKIKTLEKVEVPLESLVDGYPDLVIYDESGFEIATLDIYNEPEAVADAGYFDRSSRSLLFYRDEGEAQNDCGHRALAEATWED